MVDHLDTDEQKNIDWHKKGEGWMQLAKGSADWLRKREHLRCVALLCQFVSNKYFLKTQNDQRMEKTRLSYNSDRWITVDGVGSSWHEEARQLRPQKAESLFQLTSEKLRYAYEGLAVSQVFCDPLANWYELIQFISVSERLKLKGKALEAETLRAGAHTLRLLYQDLYKDKLPHPNEVAGETRISDSELSVRQDSRRHLEFVVNCYGLNPQPKLTLIVEGKTEEAAIQKIFELYYLTHPGKYGIELVVLNGVNNATGPKKGGYSAILRLMDYLNHHQTPTFIILDDENNARKLVSAAKELKSMYNERRYAVNSDHISILKNAFEFSNFSCDEIVTALNKLVRIYDEPDKGYAKFNMVEVMTCANDDCSISCLTKLYKEKTTHCLDKIKLGVILVENMILQNSEREIQDRPIIEILEHVRRLAINNPLPTSYESWKVGQSTGLLG